MCRFLIAFLLISAATGAPAAADNTVRWASQGDALTLDPNGQNEGPTLTLIRQIYESLVKRDPDLKLIPGLATEWRLVEPTVWEFDLRRGVSFHDGQAFTADDVVFSIERAKSPTSDFGAYVATVDRVEKVDDFTIRLHTRGPNPILPDELTEIYMMSRAWAEEHGVEVPVDPASGEESFATRNANGTGPFVVELREPDIRTVLRRNTAWWGLAEPEAHNIDRIEYTPIANAPTRVSALRSGRLDLMLDVPVQDIPQLERAPDIDILQTANVRTIFLGLNVDREPFNDPRVREALYRAINIEAIRRIIMRGQAQPAGIITAPQVRGYTAELDERLSYDPDAARDLLADAGYADGFRVTLDCPNNRYVNDEAICQSLVPMFARIGVEIDLQSVPKSQHFPKIEQRETDFYLLGWGVASLDSHYVFRFLAVTGGPWNATNWSDPEFDALVEAAGVEIDGEKRTAMLQQAWAILKQSNAYLPLHHQVLSWAVSDRFSIPIQGDNQVQFRYGRVLD